MGDYFRTSEIFLAENDYSVIKKAALHNLNQSITPSDIKTVNICLVKHGRFYHPAKVILGMIDGNFFSMALNMAFSSEGIACAGREYRSLSALGFMTDQIPKVYGQFSLSSKAEFACVAFLAEWFENYHEFHLSLDHAGAQKLIVWDSGTGHYFLSDDDTYSVYRQAAGIMTRCYNPYTCELVQPWHHAAGDFVVKRCNGTVDVRLITVRQYTSLFQDAPDADDLESLSEAAVMFLIGLSIRMRLDRLDGVGEPAWAAPSAVAATVDGFLDGLQTRSPEQKQHIIKTLGTLSLDDIQEYAEMIMDSYNPMSPDLKLIEKNIINHGLELYQSMLCYRT